MAKSRRSIGLLAVAVASAVLIALPTFSTGATVKPKLRSFEAAQARQAPVADPQTTPPLHGTNPHGQGTVAVVDLNPSANRPFSADPTGAPDNEDVVVGRSRGEQRADGTYHGHITVAALFGNEILAGADTAPGQSVHTGIAQNLLDQLCTGTGICLSAVRVDSDTTATGSTNRFSLASAALGGTAGIPPSLRIGAAESEGNISSDGTCQTSRGASQVANVTAGLNTVASLSTASSDTRACRDQAPTQTNTSRVIQLGAMGLPIPAPGCDNGTPDVVTGIPGVLPIVCNADDSSATGGTQATAPYGVREALDVYLLAVGPTAVAKLTTGAAESLAVAPAAAPPPPPPPPPPEGPDGGGQDGGGQDDDGGGGPGGGGAGQDDVGGADDDGAGDDGAGDDGAGPGAGDGAGIGPGAAQARSARGDQLPFTGTDVVVLGLAGSILLAAGLVLRGPARRRELGS